MRKSAIVVGIVIVVLIVFAAVGRFNVNGYKPRIQAQLGKSLNRNVTMGDVSLRLLPPGLRVESPFIGDDPAFNTQSSFVRADVLNVSVRLLPLLGGNIDVAALNLQRPVVELVKNAQGVWNFSTLGGSKTFVAALLC
jgi:AsmA protein